MEGVIDPILREFLTAHGGIDRAVTEFVRVTDRLLPTSIFYKYSPELHHGGKTKSGVPVFVQLLGGVPGPMGENAALAASLGAPGIDLNFGCPAKTVNRHDGGAALLKTPSRVFDVTRAVRLAVPSHIPVTVKVRLGFDHKDFALDIARAACAGGASALTVHARTRLELYQPPAHWEYVALMKEVVRIPVIANGEIWSVEDYQRCRKQSGVDAVALGRGLVARPSLAREIRQSLTGEASFPLPWSSLQASLVDFIGRCRVKSDDFALARGKQWTKQLGRTYPEARELFEKMKIARKLAEWQSVNLV
jgi:tRNA-dihydrouridine synthase C